MPVTNSIYTKILKCFVKIYSLLSEMFSFPFYFFEYGWNFRKYEFFCLKKKFYEKAPLKEVESFLITFFTTSNRKLFSIELWRNPLREKCSNTEIFLVFIFPHLDWIRSNKNYLHFVQNCVITIKIVLLKCKEK